MHLATEVLCNKRSLKMDLSSHVGLRRLQLSMNPDKVTSLYGQPGQRCPSLPRPCELCERRERGI